MTSATTIQLHGFAKASPNIPSDSFFCQKLETYLRLANFPRDRYALVDAVPFFQPKGKLPCITLSRVGQPDEYIADSHFIIKGLLEKGIVEDVDAKAGLTAEQRADARAWQAWTEDLVYPIIVATRWLRPKNYAITASELAIPWLIKPILTLILYRRIRGTMLAVGVAKHTEQEQDTLMLEWVDALDTKLQDGRIWFHKGLDVPTSVDAMLGGLLMNCGQVRGTVEFNEMWMARPKIRDYAERSARLWFPEYELFLGTLEAKKRVH